MWQKAIDNKQLKLIVEITTHCNAKCPQCVRNNQFGLETADFFPLVHWTLDDFKRRVNSETLDVVKHIHFSGTLGEPFMNPNIEDIFEYIFETSDTTISFSTNGSVRSEEFWWDIGSRFGERISNGIFCVDGSTQEMHEFYRRNTSLEKVLNNMEVFSQTPAGVSSFTVLFKHNQDFQEEIKQMIQDRGVFAHDFMQSNRFGHGEKFEYTYKNEKHILEQVDNEMREVGLDEISRKVKDHRHHHNQNFKNIRCDWAFSGRVDVKYNGEVWPCCYTTVQDQLFQQNLQRDPNWKWTLENREKSNLTNYNIVEILNNDFFRPDGILERSIQEVKSALPVCRKFCGKC